MCVLPHVVVVVVGGASGRAVVRVHPLGSLLIDEGIGSRWTHKHVWNRRARYKQPLLDHCPLDEHTPAQRVQRLLMAGSILIMYYYV